MRINEYLQLDAMDQVTLVKEGQVSSSELLEVALERMNQINPSINAIVTNMHDEAKKTIEKDIIGEFSGVPFLLKDLGASYKGIRLTSGSKLFKDFVSTIDSELVSRYKKSGLVTFGKTNTPEFGLVATTESELLGACRNPWDVNLTSGGSSGGSAAAVAVGIVPLAHGSDGGGSIRIPASCCGVFGLKPTRGRNPMNPNSTGILVEHVITRSVRDSARMLDNTSQPFYGTPYWAPPPKRPYIEEITDNKRKFRIAYSKESIAETSVHKDCIDSLHNTVELCKELGHEVIEDQPNFESFKAFPTIFLMIWASGLVATIKYIQDTSNIKVTPNMVEPLTWALYEHGKQYLGGDYILAMSFCQQLSQEVARFFKNYDLWLTPTLGEPPVPLGTFDAPEENPMKAIKRMTTFTPFTSICNVTGQPAMSVPLYWNAQNLPIGSQFIGRFGDESTLLNLAGQLEKIKPWKKRIPQL